MYVDGDGDPELDVTMKRKPNQASPLPNIRKYRRRIDSTKSALAGKKVSTRKLTKPQINGVSIYK